ncbi:hypothetical protein G5714_001350 [Onychostoma macrolepis]|uniref:Uncharacterized protein n=1 Tax=Onychostoma macrolepis TaxID=369639 RepID=A0A7J6DBV3_9TELE|nr:hypothetical protein G5714_001350 [Onychostoma macrolepis]
MRQGQTVQTFLPTSNTLSSRRSVTSTQQVSVCNKQPSSVSFSVAVGRRIKLSPLLPVPSSPAARMIGDTFGSLSQPSVTVDSLILTKDTIGFPSWWTTSSPPDLLDTPTLLPLSHFFHEWERLPGVSPWVLRTIRSGYTLQFGRNPPHFDGVNDSDWVVATEIRQMASEELVLRDILCERF